MPFAAAIGRTPLSACSTRSGTCTVAVCTCSLPVMIARDVEDVVDQLCLQSRVAADGVDRLAGSRRRQVAALQQLHPADDGTERRAQLVRQRGQELVLEACRLERDVLGARPLHRERHLRGNHPRQLQLVGVEGAWLLRIQHELADDGAAADQRDERQRPDALGGEGVAERRQRRVGERVGHDDGIGIVGIRRPRRMPLDDAAIGLRESARGLEAHHARTVHEQDGRAVDGEPVLQRVERRGVDVAHRSRTTNRLRQREADSDLTSRHMHGFLVRGGHTV